MAPFPETEIMTIKRLEVALRKGDYKLLKDGAYKLHEKYHGGFKFEYLDLLKEIFLEVTNNSSIPPEIKDILNPTIEDILSQQGVRPDTTTSPQESLNQNRVSSLTSLSYSTNINQEQNDGKINAFDAFGASKPQQQAPAKIFTQSPFSAEPFREFHNPIAPQPINMAAKEPVIEQKENTVAQQMQQAIEQKESFETQTYQEQPIQNESETVEQKTEQIEPEVAPQIEPQEEIKEEIKEKTIAIFYGQEFSSEKSKNIEKLHSKIANAHDKEVTIFEILNLISEINTQADSNVLELKSIVEQLKARGKKATIITNSQSANFDELFNSSELKYGIFNSSQENDFNLMPLFGLSNLFECSNCHQTYLEKKDAIKSLISQCPHCKAPMIAGLYHQDKNNTGVNIEYYNNALMTLVKSNTWVLIKPMLDDSLVTNLLKSAIQLSNGEKEIYILDKDINTRETYKNVFLNFNRDHKINTQINAIEDFFASLN